MDRAGPPDGDKVTTSWNIQVISGVKGEGGKVFFFSLMLFWQHGEIAFLLKNKK